MCESSGCNVYILLNVLAHVLAWTVHNGNVLSCWCSMYLRLLSGYLDVGIPPG